MRNAITADVSAADLDMQDRFERCALFGEQMRPKRSLKWEHHNKPGTQRYKQDNNGGNRKPAQPRDLHIHRQLLRFAI